MKARELGNNQEIASAKAGISERTGRRIEGRESGVAKPRHWRTREDPLKQVWESELVPLLDKEPALTPISLLEELQRRHPGEYPDAVQRTLQRRVKRWRATEGPEQAVMFRQSYPPGHQGISDFTQLKGVQIIIGGQPFNHLLYHFRMVFSGFCYVMVVLGGESFAALSKGLQEALCRLGGVPKEHRTDSLSAAFKNLTKDEQEDITARYQALSEHYGMRATRNNRGKGHENGAIESPHGHFKKRVKQALLLRGSYEFIDITSYQQFVDGVVAHINRRNGKAIAEERNHLSALPDHRGVDYSEAIAVVTSSATITVKRVLYSVPSRLKGERLLIHVYDDQLIGYLGSEPVVTLSRQYAKDNQRVRQVDYRHLIGSLRKKPQAFRYSQIRDDLLPNDAWRRMWQLVDELLTPKAACRWIVSLLALAADEDVESQLADYALPRLVDGDVPSLVELQRQFASSVIDHPVVEVKQHALSEYDSLQTSTEVSA